MAPACCWRRRALVAVGAARADTVAGFEDETPIYVGEDIGYDDSIGDGWTEEWTDEEWVDEGWSGEEWVDNEEYLVDYDDEIAWSGIPIDEEGILYMTGMDPDWLKRGDGKGGSPAPVPLPAAGLLSLAGIAALAMVRRRRKS